MQLRQLPAPPEHICQHVHHATVAGTCPACTMNCGPAVGLTTHVHAHPINYLHRDTGSLARQGWRLCSCLLPYCTSQCPNSASRWPPSPWKVTALRAQEQGARDVSKHARQGVLAEAGSQGAKRKGWQTHRHSTARCYPRRPAVSNATCSPDATQLTAHRQVSTNRLTVSVAGRRSHSRFTA